MLEIKDELIAKMLIAHARNKQSDLASHAQQHPKGDAIRTKEMPSNQASHCRTNDDPQVVRGSSKGGPAKLFQRIERRQQNGKRSQAHQREEDNLCITDRQFFVRCGIARSEKGIKEPGCQKKKG